jgi:hypothetical protein
LILLILLKIKNIDSVIDVTNVSDVKIVVVDVPNVLNVTNFTDVVNISGDLYDLSSTSDISRVTTTEEVLKAHHQVDMEYDANGSPVLSSGLLHALVDNLENHLIPNSVVTTTNMTRPLMSFYKLMSRSRNSGSSR